MSFFEFPNTRTYDKDLGWVIEAMKKLSNIVETFVYTSTLKFADPILWNIATQYEKSTIVLNPSGNAYLSKDAVPSGIQLDNTDYWLEIFNFTDYTRTANKNLTINVETNTTRATAPYAVDDWLIWNDILYKVTSAIAIDDTFIVAPAAGANIIHFTVEEFCKAWTASCTALINQYKDDIDTSERDFTYNLETAFNQVLSGATVDSEVINARVGLATTYSVLKDAISAQLLTFNNKINGKWGFVVSGVASDGHNTTVTNRAKTITKFNITQFDIIYSTNPLYQFRLLALNGGEEYKAGNNINHYYNDWSDQYCQITTNSYGDKLHTLLIKRSDDEDLTADDLVAAENCIKWYKVNAHLVGNGRIANLPTPDLNDCVDGGWYGWGSKATVTNAPISFSGAGTLYVFPYTFNSTGTATFISQYLFGLNGNLYFRLIQLNVNGMTVSVYKDWILIGGPDAELNISALEGKTIAVIGDSISTVSYGGLTNAAEIEITNDDVGVSLSAYITYGDVANGLEIDGYTYQSTDIGNEVTFTPTLVDVGKRVGTSANYNPSDIKPWWLVMKDSVNMNVIPVSWSGASVSSHENLRNQYKTSWAWHEAQIRKCGIRTPGTMNRTAPDMIIVYRGINDFSHTPYARLNPSVFNGTPWSYPASDYDGSNYQFKEGLILTVKELRAAYPRAKIMLCTLPVAYRVNYTHFAVDNGINTLPQYNNAVREVADYLGCGIIEFDKCGITYESASLYCRDNPPVHPNNAGHKLLAQKALASISATYR